MDPNGLCPGEGKENDEEGQKLAPEKILAPFLKTLKKRRNLRIDFVPEKGKELHSSARLSELFSVIESSFADPLKLATILNETAELLRAATSSRSVNLYLTDYEQGVIILCPKYLRGNDRFLVKHKIEAGKTLAAYVAFTKEYVVSSDILGDERFPEGIPATDKTMVKAALCVPVLGISDGSCIAVIELYRDIGQPPYDGISLQLCTAHCGWVGIGIEQNSERLKLSKEDKLHHYLLSLVRMYFEEILTFDKAISDLMLLSKATIDAEKCTFYRMDETVPPETRETFFCDVYAEALDASRELAIYKKKKKARFQYEQPGVPGYVARTGKTVIIKDAYKDHRFDATLDAGEFRSRSIIAVPVKITCGVIGVLELVNKLTCQYFSKEEAKVMELFAMYASLICEHEELLKKNKHEDLELEVTRELLFFHTKPTLEEFNTLRSLPVLNSHQMPPGFFRFDWNTFVYEDEIFKYVLFAFLGSELIPPLFDHASLASFVLSVNKAYRSVPYHNFQFAFCVFHFVYNLLSRNADKFATVEIVSLLIAGLCTDLDHRGTSNSFLEMKNSPIALLYDDSPLEQHHYHVSLLLIQANQLLSKFTAKEYKEIVSDMHRLMLATNFSFFFRSKKDLVTLINEDLFDWKNPNHRALMKGFVFNCAQFSPNLKTFDVARKNVDNYYKELFAQGDLESSMGFTPATIMDRTRAAFVPDFHISFLDTLVMPCIEVVVTIFPNCEEIRMLCSNGLEKWKELAALRGVDVWKPEESNVKERKSRGHRSTGTSIMSSGKSVQSDQKSGKFTN